MVTSSDQKATVSRKARSRTASGKKGKKAYGAESVFDEWLVSDLMLKHLPRATRLIFTVMRVRRWQQARVVLVL